MGEIVTSVQKTTLVPGGDEVVLYGTIFGTIGALLPVPSRDTLHQMIHVEMFLRKQEPSAGGSRYPLVAQCVHADEGGFESDVTCRA